jgi:hypothetical protein
LYLENAVPELNKQSGGHPQLTQHLASKALERIRKADRKTFDAQDIQKAGEDLLAENDHLFTTIFQMIDQYRIPRIFIKQVSDGNMKFTRLKRDILRAEQIGIIKNEGGMCRLRSPLIAKALDYYYGDGEQK